MALPVIEYAEVWVRVVDARLRDSHAALHRTHAVAETQRSQYLPNGEREGGRTVKFDYL